MNNGFKKPRASNFTKAIRNECDFDEEYLKNELKNGIPENTINVFADD